MPRVKIGHAYSVYVEIEASELRAAAREEFEHAVKVTSGVDPGPAGGLTTETRWFPAHTDPKGGYGGRSGFAPVKAGGE
ncbi:MAG TPA: hypothetical protein VFC00_30995 [Micromonosporaceae bacterium]|nr:hypothetical protein [Micromonosporaceae bacterium]